jgi:hydrogenase/urease accessory protein HupE
VRRSWLAVVLICFALPLQAHELRPAYLRIAELPGGAEQVNYEVLWRLPVGAEIPLRLEPVMPDNCEMPEAPDVTSAGLMRSAKLIVQCRGGLAGETIRIAGLESALTDVLVRIERADGTAQVERLTPASTSLKVTTTSSGYQVAGTYTLLGIEHIWLGIDHLLFVLALLLVVDGVRRLVLTITAFTIAHSITLAAATLGLLAVPQQPVEAVIALSIVFVCLELLRQKKGLAGAGSRQPWLVAFAFGLLHGLGFAGALNEIGLPENAIPAALLFFNVGVEIGQLLFIAGAVAVCRVIDRIDWPAWVKLLPVYGIGGLAAFWTIERVAGFWA